MKERNLMKVMAIIMVMACMAAGCGTARGGTGTEEAPAQSTEAAAGESAAAEGTTGAAAEETAEGEEMNEEGAREKAGNLEIVVPEDEDTFGE